MLFFIIKWFILYLLLIFITHYLYLFFEKNLTSTKTKDFIGFSNSEYNKINKILETNNNNSINTIANTIANTITNNKTNIMDFKSDNLDFKSDKFDLNSFNSIFETNNFSQENNNNSISMAGDLDEFLNKLNSK